MRTMPETAAITARITSPSCAIWPLISCPRNPPKAPCVSKSNGPAGRTPTSQSSSPKSEMRLPCMDLGAPRLALGAVLGPLVGVVADQLLLLGIDRDHRLIVGLEAGR